MILAVSLSSRVLGLALLKDGELIDYKARLFKDRWREEKSSQMLAEVRRWLEDFNPNHVAFMLPRKTHKTTQAKLLYDHIKILARHFGLDFHSFSYQTLSYFCPDCKAKKRRLMQVLAERYPELYFPYQKELRNKKKYHIKVFEALAAALLLERKLTG